MEKRRSSKFTRDSSEEPLLDRQSSTESLAEANGYCGLSLDDQDSFDRLLSNNKSKAGHYFKDSSGKSQHDDLHYKEGTERKKHLSDSYLLRKSDVNDHKYPNSTEDACGKQYLHIDEHFRKRHKSDEPFRSSVNNKYRMKRGSLKLSIHSYDVRLAKCQNTRSSDFDGKWESDVHTQFGTGVLLTQNNDNAFNALSNDYDSDKRLQEPESLNYEFMSFSTEKKITAKSLPDGKGETSGHQTADQEKLVSDLNYLKGLALLLERDEKLELLKEKTDAIDHDYIRNAVFHKVPVKLKKAIPVLQADFEEIELTNIPASERSETLYETIDHDYIRSTVFPKVPVRPKEKLSELQTDTDDTDSTDFIDSPDSIYVNDYIRSSVYPQVQVQEKYNMRRDDDSSNRGQKIRPTSRAVHFIGSVSSDNSSDDVPSYRDSPDASLPAQHDNSTGESIGQAFVNKALSDRHGSLLTTHRVMMKELKHSAQAKRRKERVEKEKQKAIFRKVLLELKEKNPVMELDEETKWICKHIKRRECSHFIKSSNKKADHGNKDSVICQCGYQYKYHSAGAQKNEKPEGKWDYKLHSIQKTTNAFGDIEFAGYGGNIGKYIRVDVDTKMFDMLELLMNIWGLDKPNLLISVTGGAKNFQMNKRLKETFRRGLMKTALTTGAWIVTGGTHAGVMKHVGEAVKDFGVASTSKNPVISIGIAPWGCIQNRQALEDNNCTGSWPANYRIEKEQKAKESFLDPNHTHFILVDNATQHQFAVEIPFRARLEHKVSQIMTDTGENAVSVPIVLLVLEGGPGTLETVHQSIQNNTPSVIVKGSGRAADILAKAYLSAKEEEVEGTDQHGKKQRRTRRYMEDSVLMEVRDMVEKEFKTDVDTHMGRIKDCLEKCDFMSVFELDNRSGVKEIDVAMLQALLKANKNQVMDQLRLALAWNRIDVAKSDIFTDDKRWPTGSLDDVMFSAIQLNRTDFIELFLDHGVSLREFLTKKRLLMLYNKIPQNCLLRTLLNRTKAKIDPHRKNFSLADVGTLIQSLMGDSFRPTYITRKEYAMLDVDNILEGSTLKQAKEGTLSGFKAVAQMAMNPASNQKEADGPRQVAYLQPDFEHPTQELFIWSVLMIRQDMAKLFWAEGKDAIAAALVANSLLCALKDKTEDTELVNTIKVNLEEWSDLSVGVLSECHSADEHKAQDLLVRELSNWGDTTCMLIAVKADNKDFISQTACQSLLNSIWMGKLAKDSATWRLLLCVICPPLSIVLLNYQPVLEDSTNNVKSQEYMLNNAKMDETGKSLPVLRRQMTSVKSNFGTLANSRASLRAAEEKDTEEREADLKRNFYSVRDRIYYFFNAPVIIFMNNVLSYLVFLGLFTYVLIFDFHSSVSPAEIVLIIWVFTIFTEELRQVATTSSSTLGAKLQSYITDTWNIVDMITIVLFIIGMVLRFLPYPQTFEAARVFLALNFVSFFLRLLHIFSVHKELGPKLVMIGRMVQDLMYFMIILMVFIVSYAIASHSILYPNSPLRIHTAIDVIRKSYWNIYGELFLDEIEGKADCTYDEMLWINGSTPRCPTDTGKVFVPIMMGVYMLLANVLLLNLLIAMFSYTFTLVQDNTDKHWAFQRYSLIYEYYTRPVLCPPLIFFSHIYLLIKSVIECCCCREKSEDIGNDFRRKFKNERELVQWENVIADAFHQKTELKDFDSTEYKVNNTNILIKDLTARIDEIQEHQQLQQQLSLAASDHVSPVLPLPTSPSSVEMKIPLKLESRLEALEKHMEATHASLQWIIQALQESKVASNTQIPPPINDFEQEKLEAKLQEEEKQRERKSQVYEMLQRGINLQIRSRTSPYMGSDVARFPVPDDLVPWDRNFPEYSPSVYTAREVLDKPSWADPDILHLTPQQRVSLIPSFNTFDSTNKINRASFVGPYVVQNGIPLNPMGRTGLQGRGLLGRWGPNHAGDPIVTRWKMQDGAKVTLDGKPVLEFVAVLRSDNQMWALPGGMLLPGAKPSDTLEADFTEEALGALQDAKDQKYLRKKLGKLWRAGVKIYEGYADDPRNTDNAWIETTAFYYHDNKGNIIDKFNLKAGESVKLATWLTLSHKVTMHGSHLYLLKLVADKLQAYF